MSNSNAVSHFPQYHSRTSCMILLCIYSWMRTDEKHGSQKPKPKAAAGCRLSYHVKLYYSLYPYITTGHRACIVLCSVAGGLASSGLNSDIMTEFNFITVIPLSSPRHRFHRNEHAQPHSLRKYTKTITNASLTRGLKLTPFGKAWKPRRSESRFDRLD